ncbi:MAG: DUF2135 domain-containing protein [Cocleimonas sp.]|nr:DUF2135 domain-containing protein [Cocleimonas sp.]
MSNSFAKPISNRVVIPPVVIKLADPKLKPIALTELIIDSQVISNIATSTYELVFYNPNNRILEGELVFSLFDGQSVIDYALQINGKYRQASIVPKAKATEAYENTIRAQIDPSIIEKAIGNNFKTRLYPIPAKGHKRIKITLQEILDSRNNKLQYRIPFVSKQALKKLKINIGLPSLSSKPSSNYDGFQFDKASQGQSIKLEKTNALIKQAITIQIDNPVERSSFVQKSAGDSFIFTSLEHHNLMKKQIKPPRNIAILWNNSLSNRLRDIEKELNFLKSYIQNVGTAQVQLIFYSNNSTHKNIGVICAQGANCSNGNPFSYLKKLIKNQHFDGTSDYSKIDLSKINADEILLFSNGIRTIYKANLKNTSKPISAINTSLQSDTDLLKRYAHTSNGHFIDLNKVSVDEGIKQFFSHKTHIKVLETSSNIERENVFVTFENNRLGVLAKSAKGSQQLNSADWIKLAITRQGETFQKVIKLSNIVPVKQNINSLWASQKINQLSFDYAKNKDAIIDLAKKYKVLTKDVSLIVLDRVEDYVRYEISPPSELRKKYSELLKLKINKKIYEKEQALVESIKLLQEQQVWYNKAFPKTKPKPVTRQKVAESDVSAALEQAAPAMAPVAAPARPAPRYEFQKAKKGKLANKSSVANAKNQAKITLKAFDPKAPYIKKIKATDKSKWLEAYYIQKKSHIKQAMFYVDVADLFYKNNMKKEAIVILSNILELDFDNSELLRVFALKTMEFGEYKLAIKAFEKVKELRPFEPQSFRDLALAYNKNKEPQKAANMLYDILVRTWDSRFSGIKIVIINELNNILAKHKNVNKSKIDRRLISSMPVDLRIVINWSSDNTDIDLWVVDPYKEKTFYSNKISRIGGKISNDITRGYGPEEFMIKDAVAGTYKIQTEYYGNSQQKLAIPVTIRAQIFSKFSKIGEVQKDLVLRLKNEKAVIDIGEFLFEK